MTVYKEKYELQNKNEKIKNTVITFASVSISLTVSLYLSPAILNYVKSGLSLCYTSVIGSVFPFLILTDLIVCNIRIEDVPLAKNTFERLFKINGAAISAYLIGILCGFPLGVKVASELYKDGYITKDECERLIGFSNNTGPAFVISGVGAAMLKDTETGVFLYLSMLISSVAVGIILGIGKNANKGCVTAQKGRFSFTSSVKSAAYNTVSICGFVIIFSVICGFFTLLTDNELIYAIIAPFFEISNACKIASGLNTYAYALRIMIISFAISFSGLSVHLQAKSFLSNSDISMKKYYPAKLLQGLISAIITYVFLVLK